MKCFSVSVTNEVLYRSVVSALDKYIFNAVISLIGQYETLKDNETVEDVVGFLQHVEEDTKRFKEDHNYTQNWFFEQPIEHNKMKKEKDQYGTF